MPLKPEKLKDKTGSDNIFVLAVSLINESSQTCQSGLMRDDDIRKTKQLYRFKLECTSFYLVIQAIIMILFFMNEVTLKISVRSVKINLNCISVSVVKCTRRMWNLPRHTNSLVFVKFTSKRHHARIMKGTL